MAQIKRSFSVGNELLRAQSSYLGADASLKRPNPAKISESSSGWISQASTAVRVLGPRTGETNEVKFIRTWVAVRSFDQPDGLRMTAACLSVGNWSIRTAPATMQQLRTL